MREAFPFQCLQRMAQPNLVGQSLDSGRSVSGASSVNPTMRGYWTVQATMLIAGADALLQFQAFLAGMEGRIGTTLVPVESWVRALDRDGHLTTQRFVASMVEGATFEHWGFEAEPVVQAVVAEAAALRATRLRFALGDTTGLRPGQYFSIGERMYWAQRVWQDAGGHVVQFQPPLREAVPTGAAMVLDRVQCRMRLADERVAFDPRQPLVQTVAVNFEEAV
jgi:hypothetical protein